MSAWDTKHASRRLVNLERRFDDRSEEFLWKLFCPIRHSLDNYTNAWPMYKDLNKDQNFVPGFLESKIHLWARELPSHLNESEIFQIALAHQGGVGRSPGLAHTTLGDIEHYNWAKALGFKHITDSLDEMGRSLFHASCLASNNSDPRVIVQILKDKAQEKVWIPEKTKAIHDFFQHAFMYTLDVVNAKEAVELLEKHQPEALKREYVNKNTKTKAKVVHSVRIGLWYKLVYANQFSEGINSHVKFLEDWLNDWNKRGAWLPSEKSFLTETWDKVPTPFKKVMLSSKAQLEKNLLTKKCAVSQDSKKIVFGGVL